MKYHRREIYDKFDVTSYNIDETIKILGKDHILGIRYYSCNSHCPQFEVSKEEYNPVTGSYEIYYGPYMGEFERVSPGTVLLIDDYRGGIEVWGYMYDKYFEEVKEIYICWQKQYLNRILIAIG